MSELGCTSTQTYKCLQKDLNWELCVEGEGGGSNLLFKKSLLESNIKTKQTGFLCKM